MLFGRLVFNCSIARIIHMESLVGLITKEQRSPFMCGNYICRILFTFVLYGVWFLLSKKKAVLNTPIHGFVSFPQINLICNYCAIVVLCIFTIFCEQENVCFSFNFPCHDMSQEASVNYYIMYVTNIFSKDPHSLPHRTFNKILWKITKNNL